MSEEKLLGRYEMLWDCAFCGKTKLLGITHRHCPECGGAQDQTKRYFPADGDKVEVKDDYAGTDRACGSCKHPNGSKATFCARCGAPLAEAGVVKQRSVQVVKAGQLFDADDVKKAEAELGDNVKPKPMGVKKKSWAWLYTLIVVGVAIFAIWFMCIRKRSAEMEVTAARWKRAIVIEEYKEVEEDHWKHERPSSGRELSCRDKKFESKKVEDGQDCSMKRVDKGDGTFEEREECVPKYRSEDVDRPWCTYAVMKWTKFDEKVTQGDGTSERTWPKTGVKPQKQLPGARREGPRTETFTIDLKEAKNGKSHSCDISEALYDKLPVGTAVKAEVRARSGDIVCSSVAPKKK